MFDWYGSEDASQMGLARHLVDTQLSSDLWNGAIWVTGDLSTAWALVILSSSIIELAPVAVCKAEPDVTGAGEPVELDGLASFHQDPDGVIVQWEWDFDGDCDFQDASGPVVQTTFNGLGMFNVKLRVTDSNGLQDIQNCPVSTVPPPIPPNADPGGPYDFCLNENEPFILDGSDSSDPDDFIVSLAWDFTPQPLDMSFDDSMLTVVDVTTFFTMLGPGTYDVGLKVQDSNGLENTDFTTVTVYADGDCPPPPITPECFLLAGFQKTDKLVNGGDHLLVKPLKIWPMTSQADMPVLQVPTDPAFVGLHLYLQVYMDNPVDYPKRPLQAVERSRLHHRRPGLAVRAEERYVTPAEQPDRVAG